MKLLFFKSNLYMQEDWFQALKEDGHEVDSIHHIFKDFLKDDAFAEKLESILREKKYHAVISCNFFPVVSDVCENCKTPYISWIYDSPIPNFHRFDTPYNRIYHFDRLETDQYREQGYDFIHHLPLAVNTRRLDKQLGSLEECPAYTYDISFIGNLYGTRSILSSGLTDSPYLLGLLEGYAAVQTQFFNENVLDTLFKNSSHIKMDEFAQIYPWSTLYNIIHEEATGRERHHLLRKLAEHHPIDLFTNSRTEKIENLSVHPPVDYYKKMPEVFRHSRINLNISYRAIKSGMSARILDIMGCGGFLMTTPQPELFDHFVEDLDFVAFRSQEELMDKCAYYLTHEEERLKITQNGYRKIKAAHTYQHRLPLLLSEI